MACYLAKYMLHRHIAVEAMDTFGHLTQLQPRGRVLMNKIWFCLFSGTC